MKTMSNKYRISTEFSERGLGTNPRFKKPRAIGEKVGKVEGKQKGFELRKGQKWALEQPEIKSMELYSSKKAYKMAFKPACGQTYSVRHATAKNSMSLKICLPALWAGAFPARSGVILQYHPILKNYPAGPHLERGGRKAKYLNGFPQQGHINTCFLISGILAITSATALWIRVINLRSLSMDKELLVLRKP